MLARTLRQILLVMTHTDNMVGVCNLCSPKGKNSDTKDGETDFLQDQHDRYRSRCIRSYSGEERLGSTLDTA